MSRTYVPPKFIPGDEMEPSRTEPGYFIGEADGTEYTAGNWPTVDLGFSGDDSEPRRVGSVSDGTALYLHDANDGVWYRNPDTVETFSYVTGPDGNRYVAVHAPVFGSGVEPHEAPITSYMTERQHRDLAGDNSFSGGLKDMLNSPIGQFGMALLGPYGQVINSLYQASQGNTTGAILGGLGAAGQFAGADLAALNAAEKSGDIINASRALDLADTVSNTKLATTVLGGLDAASKKNLAGVLNAGLSGATQMGVALRSGVSTAAQLANAATALESGNTSAFLNAVGDLAGSPDVKTAAAAANLIQLASSGNLNPSALLSATRSLASTASAGSNQSSENAPAETVSAEPSPVDDPTLEEILSSPTEPAPVEPETVPEPSPVDDPTLEEILSQPTEPSPVDDPTLEEILSQPTEPSPVDDPTLEEILSQPGAEEPTPVYDYGEPNPEYDIGGVGDVTTDYFDSDGNRFAPDGTQIDELEPIEIVDSRPNPVYDYGEPNPEYDIDGVGEVTTNYFDELGNEFLPDGTPVYDYDEDTTPNDRESVTLPTPTPPKVAPPKVTPPKATPPAATDPAPTNKSGGVDIGALLALLGGMSGSSQPAVAPTQVAPAEVQLMEEIFGSNLFSKDPGGISAADAKAGKRNFNDGGSVDELLHLLRG